MTETTIFHTAIIGGGASGLFCAGSFNNRKIVLEANSQPAIKVSVSGGGKCNFTNKMVSAKDYVSQGKHFCKNALAGFSHTDFTQLLDENNIAWEERENGKLFAYDAKKICKFLIERAKKNNTDIYFDTRVLDVVEEKGLYKLVTSKGIFLAQHIVLATGGLSFPSLGANGFGLKMASKWGIKTVETVPALCGLNWPKELRLRFGGLAGNSLPVKVTCQKQQFQDALLFAHDGVTGPSILQTSLFWTEGTPITINFAPSIALAELISVNKNSTKTITNFLGNYIPVKVAKALLNGLDVKLADMTKEQIKQVVECIHAFTFVPSGTFGYTKAEVTKGGISTTEINPTTFQLRKYPSVYAVGEVIDVTGRLGGFNLHWAWCSGFAAAKHLEKTF